VIGEAIEERQRFVVTARVHAVPRLEKRPDQPRPHRALVIRRIACPKVAEVLRLEHRVGGVECAQPERRQQSLRDHVHHGRPV
jgi:hypothetical protein